MVSTTTKGDKLAVSLVSHPVLSVELGKLKVAGVVSTQPAYMMNQGLQGDTVVQLALLGRVPCKVVGKVKKGDMLTTAGVAGYACKAINPTLGAVIGKALEDFNGESGIIEVVVGKH